MAIQALDERHKQLAEELLKGTPRSKIAEIVGVHRSTLYEWMKDPLWQEYFEKLAADLNEARGMRLLVTVMKACEMTELYLDRLIEAMGKGDLSEVPSLDTMTTALKRLAELQRLDAGQPTQIARRESHRSDDGGKTSERGHKVKGWLDALLANPEEPRH